MQLWSHSKPDKTVDFKWRKVVIKHFLLPNGSEGEFITDTWGHDTVAVVGLTQQGKVVVAKQFRPGPEKILYELPGGGGESGEDPKHAAMREFEEETGYVTDKEPIYLGMICKSGYFNDEAHYYLALDCYRHKNQELDSTEIIEVVEQSFDDMIGFANQGLVSDAVALYMARDKIKEMEQTNE